MTLAADMGRHSGRATPSLHDAPYRQFEKATGRRSTYPLPIPVQTNRATSMAWLSPETMARMSAWLLASGIAAGPVFRRINVLTSKPDGDGQQIQRHFIGD